MADETQVKADTAATPTKIATAAADPVKTTARAAAKAAPRTRKAATARKTANKARRTSAKPRKSSTAQPKSAAAAFNKRTSTMNFDSNRWFSSFNAFPTATPFQSLFGDAGARGQDVAARSQNAAGELADLARGNVDALTEASRIAAEGARSLGQDMVASTRHGLEKAADAVRSLAEAKSPTEFAQIQSELARAFFF